MNKEQLAIDIVYAQDKDLDLTPEYWEKKISTLLKRQRQEIIEMIDETIVRGMIYDGERSKTIKDFIKTLTKP